MQEAKTTQTPIRVVQDPTYGHRRLDPVPDADELARYYESQYYHAIRQGKTAVGMRDRLEDKSRQEEIAWLGACLYTDVAAALRVLAPGPRVLDAGCGMGEFVSFLDQQGFAASGVDPSDEAVSRARSAGLDVRAGTLADVVADPSARYDAVTSLNVLEHVPDPAALLDQTRQVLVPGGVACICVPNDFSALQSAAAAHTARKDWWIAAPDHINYFDFDSLERFVSGRGFSVLKRTTDFPMEFFLLMGDDYTAGDPTVGKACHARRKRFELALPPVLRQALYEALAGVGIGRNCVLFARRVD